jgi:hypothetical protein
MKYDFLKSAPGFNRELLGLEGGTTTVTFSSAINVGDRVVRGPSWDWGDVDGGAGGYGDVREIKAWKGKPNAGILVMWRDSNFQGLYRWDYEGCFDLKVVGHSDKSLKPIIIQGSLQFYRWSAVGTSLLKH